ncbi:MAG: MFS transporter [Candidatus Symbiothrix sp.]|jgi:GPH family glycoside/pentoside/hexuronide:cation symporter|nr:MFS transporter [Candidatus Symbiothrix sp.]
MNVALKEKIGYGFGDMASSMFWKIFGMYLLFFYTKVFGISPAAAGTMFMLVRIFDAVNDPLMGIIADRTHTRWGKYRPYLLWFAIPFALVGITTFYTPHLDETGRLIYAYITYTLMMVVYTTVNVPYASLLGVMSANPKQRNTLSSYRMFFAFIGSFITFMLLQPLVDFFAAVFDSDANLMETMDATSISRSPTGWVLAVAVIGVICAGLFFLCFKLTRERVKPVDEEKNKNTSVKEDIKNLFRNTPWWILMVSGIGALLFNAIRDGVALFYFADYIQVNYKMPYSGWTMATVYLLIGQAANMIGVALAAPLSNRFGKKQTYMVALSLAAGFSAVFFILTPDDILWILLLQILVSVCAGYVLPLLWSMYADIVDHQELKTNRRATGLIFSSSSMSQKIGSAVGVALTGWLLAAFGYYQDAAVQTGSAILGVRLMMSWLPAASCVLAIVAMIFYPLSEKKVKKITAELEKRRMAK